MKHPDRATLALHAGGDLGPFARWRTQRHLANCGECRDEAARFLAVRAILPELAEAPEISWNRLAAEMKANIRLGLAAGECVRTGQAPLRETPLFTRARAVVAFASVVVLLFAGLVLQHPAPGTPKYDGVVVQTTANGIQVREGGQALRLLHSGAQNVQYSVGAQGSMRARYVDPETGYVTINNVYAD
jgi:anti-sigma factor RsiW